MDQRKDASHDTSLPPADTDDNFSSAADTRIGQGSDFDDGGFLPGMDDGEDYFTPPGLQEPAVSGFNDTFSVDAFSEDVADNDTGPSRNFGMDGNLDQFPGSEEPDMDWRKAYEEEVASRDVTRAVHRGMRAQAMDADDTSLMSTFGVQKGTQHLSTMMQLDQKAPREVVNKPVVLHADSLGLNSMRIHRTPEELNEFLRDYLIANNHDYDINPQNTTQVYSYVFGPTQFTNVMLEVVEVKQSEESFVPIFCLEVRRLEGCGFVLSDFQGNLKQALLEEDFIEPPEVPADVEDAKELEEEEEDSEEAESSEIEDMWSDSEETSGCEGIDSDEHSMDRFLDLTLDKNLVETWIQRMSGDQKVRLQDIIHTSMNMAHNLRYEPNMKLFLGKNNENVTRVIGDERVEGRLLKGLVRWLSRKRVEFPVLRSCCVILNLITDAVPDLYFSWDTMETLINVLVHHSKINERDFDFTTLRESREVQMLLSEVLVRVIKNVNGSPDAYPTQGSMTESLAKLARLEGKLSGATVPKKDADIHHNIKEFLTLVNFS